MSKRYEGEKMIRRQRRRHNLANAMCALQQITHSLSHERKSQTPIDFGLNHRDKNRMWEDGRGKRERGEGGNVSRRSLGVDCREVSHFPIRFSANGREI
jgi:hypothetical protein